MKPRILLVDDDPLQRKLLSRWLTLDGYDIAEATDGDSAWQVAQHQPPDLVISDWMMPGMTGLDLCRRLRAAAATAQCYVILLTARDDTDSLSEGLEIGANEFLTKPIDGTRLRARVKAGLRQYTDHNQLLAANAQLGSMALTDALTGVRNRRAFDSELEDLLGQLVPRRPVSLLILDCDHFKRVNDTHGHLAGDQILKGFVERIQQQLRPHDHIFRYGGEEFTVLLQADLEQAWQVADRLCAVVRQAAFTTHVGQVPLTVSIGVAQAEPGDSEAQLFGRADQALYQAKLLGRDRALRSRQNGLCALPGKPIEAMPYCGFYIFDLAGAVSQVAELLEGSCPHLLDPFSLRCDHYCDSSHLQEIARLVLTRLGNARTAQLKLFAVSAPALLDRPIACALQAQPVIGFAVGKRLRSQSSC